MFIFNALLIDSIDILKTILILTEIRDKVRPFSAQYGKCNLVSKYGTFPFFKGWLATLDASKKHLKMVDQIERRKSFIWRFMFCMNNKMK